MKCIKLSLCGLIVASTFSVLAHAQATRTYISGSGDDANPCSLANPCKTFAGAISKTTAGGEIDALSPGSYGAITITKALTIDGSASLGSAIIAASGVGVTVNAGIADVVTLRNIQVQGVSTGATGVLLTQAKVLHLENCVFSYLTGNGIDLEPSIATNVFIDNTVSRDNGGNGLFILGATANVNVAISNSHFENNALNGVFGSNNSKVTARNSDSSANLGSGFLTQSNSGTASIALVTSGASFNTGPGFQAGGGATTSIIRMTGSAAFSNGSAFSTGTNGFIYTYGNNYVTGGVSATGMIPLQ